MKYIIFHNPIGEETVSIFSEMVNHSDEARAHELLTPVSAGKIYINNSGGEIVYTCINGSVTLGMKFNHEQSNKDSEIIEKHFNFTV